MAPRRQTDVAHSNGAPTTQGPAAAPSRWFALALAALSLLGAPGCAAVGLTLLGVGTGVTAGTGVAYTLDSIAYKTFTTPVNSLHSATLKTLRRMEIAVREDESTEAGRKIVAVAADRTIEIELDRLTPKTSRMRVNAKHGLFFKDRATATEIIVQTDRMLEDEPEPVSQAKRTAPAPTPKP
ncbi:MAG: DUF3568 family protein [Candidatus Rokubacteria bacterium]|nr:DUF3568 family protein [Candidatus Rokubacteria bacterium]